MKPFPLLAILYLLSLTMTVPVVAQDKAQTQIQRMKVQKHSPGITQPSARLKTPAGGDGTAGDYSECYPASSTRCDEFIENCNNDGCGSGSVNGSGTGGVSCSCGDE